MLVVQALSAEEFDSVKQRLLPALTSGGRDGGGDGDVVAGGGGGEDCVEGGVDDVGAGGGGGGGTAPVPAPVTTLITPPAIVSLEPLRTVDIDAGLDAAANPGAGSNTVVESPVAAAWEEKVPEDEENSAFATVRGTVTTPSETATGARALAKVPRLSMANSSSSLRSDRWQQMMNEEFSDGDDRFDNIGTDLTLWEKCAAALQTSHTSADDCTSLLSEYLSSSLTVDKFGVFNVLAWREAQTKQANYNELNERADKLQPVVRRLRGLTGPTGRVLKIITSCGADGDMGFAVLILMGVVMLVTFPIWVVHFSVQRLVQQLSEDAEEALDDLDQLGKDMGEMRFGTLLHCAVSHGRPEAISLLIEVRRRG